MLGLLSLEAYFRPIAAQKLYFQQWSSESMMHTVSIEDLKKEPIRSLWYIHIQPPAFDALRALLARMVGSKDPTGMMWRVDYCLYLIWAALYGLTVFLVFWWLSDIVGIAFAAVSALLFSCHPALIFYATFLETTLLSSFLILWFCYLLWRVYKDRTVPVWALAGSFLALYFTRSAFQWPWLFLLPFCLTLLRYPFRNVALFFAITSVIVGLYTVKQLCLFDLAATSSFVGFNLTRSIGAIDALGYNEKGTVPVEKTDSDLPRVLTRVRKLTGSLNFNNAQYLEINRRLQDEYRRRIMAASPGQLVDIARENLSIFLKPSSRYSPHLIVDCIPWRSAYDRVASAPILLLLLGAAALFWLRRANKDCYLRAAGLCLPIASILILSVLFERGENMRFKFFIEPVLFCFLAMQTYEAGRDLIRYALTKTPKLQETPR